MKCSRCQQQKDQKEFNEGEKTCKSCREYWQEYYKNNTKSCIERAMRQLNKDRAKTNKYKKELARRHPVNYMYTNIKGRAKKNGIPFNLTHDDIVIPNKCPILGIELKINDSKVGPDSPTLDRIIPELGYIRGNVQVISFKANTIKNNATPEEIRLVADYMEEFFK